MMFLAVVVPPAVALVWLGLRLFDQDRALAMQRSVERREAALQAVAFSLEQSLSESQRWFAEDPLPDGVVRFTLSTREVRAYPPDRVAWVPAPPSCDWPRRASSSRQRSWNFAATAAGLLAAIERLAGFALQHGSRRRVAARRARLSPPESLGNSNVSPGTVSPDGRYFTFVSWDDGNL